MNTYRFGTATLQVHHEEQSARLTLPRTWDGEYERDYAAAVLFLARSGMPRNAESECVTAEEDDLIVFAWEADDCQAWPKERLEALQREADGPLIASELRTPLHKTEVPLQAL